MPEAVPKPCCLSWLSEADMSDILKHASNKNATLKTESANTASIPTDDDEPGVKLID
jgi:hypothetical protein